MNPEEKYTCIFGGGAVRGLAYVGAVKALQELNMDCDTLVGSSVGAVIASFLALNYSYEEIKDVFLKVNFELFRDIHFSFGKSFALSKGEIFTNWVRENIEKKFYGENYIKGENKPVTFADIDKDLLIYTTDLVKFKCKEFSKQETPNFEIAEAVRISCSMPGLMTPVEVEGQKLVDGDLLKSIPLWKLSKNLKLGTNRILEFRLEGEYENVDNNAIDFINAIYSCMTSAATDNIISVYGNRDDFDYIKINTGDVIIIDFFMSETMRNKLLELGYNQSKKYLTVDLLRKKKSLIKNYTKISNFLSDIKSQIKSDNIEQSKIKLGELYIYLADVKDIISISLYDKIKYFKDKFTESAKGRKWFFFYNAKFKDKKRLLKILDTLSDSLDLKISNLKKSLEII